jgi:uncharacterized protein (DUF302 family)
MFSGVYYWIWVWYYSIDALEKRMKKSLIVLYAMTSFVGADNLVIKESGKDFAATVSQLQKSIQQSDMKILGLIDQREIAHKGTMDINDEQVILFANPNYNSRMILNDPNVALELPLKIAVRKDYQGKVWVIYRNPADLKENYKLSHCGVLPELEKALDQITSTVAIAPSQ